MKLTLIRIANKATYTIGKLYVDGKYECDVIEDTDRGLDNSMSVDEIKRKKVYGETAIPTGTYNLIINYSQKYKKQMPLLLNVKGYEGIRIHSGNTAKDTLGCLIVGQNKEVGKVINSRVTYNKLFDKLSKAKNIWVEIKRSY